MKKLTLLLALAGIATLAGCPKKDDKKDDPQAKTVDPKADPKATDPKADPKATDPKADPKAAAADLPTECNDYKTAAEKALSCEKLGTKRDELRAELEKSWTAWAKLDDKGKADLKASCAKLVTSVRTVTAAACP